MSISRELYKKISKDDLVRKKQGGIYRVITVMDDDLRDYVTCEQVNDPGSNVVSLVRSDITNVWQKKKQ